MLRTGSQAELIPNKLPDPGSLYSGPIPAGLTGLYQVNFRDQHFGHGRLPTNDSCKIIGPASHPDLLYFTQIHYGPRLRPRTLRHNV
jgi:hypothetical protein